MTYDGVAATALLRPSEMEALVAWNALVQLQEDQTARLQVTPDPDDRWAHLTARFGPGAVAPELPLVQSLTQTGDTWLDIGAGAGRFTIPLAQKVDRVVALDPSPGMVSALRSNVAESGIRNITVQGPVGWPPPASLETVDVSFAANVVYFVSSLGPFLDAMEAHARRLCVLVVSERAGNSPWEPLFSAIHGEPAAFLPGLRELVSVLAARGRPFEMRAVRLSPPPPAALAEAWRGLRARFFVAEGSEGDHRLRELLAENLMTADGDAALPNARGTQAAVVSWEPPPA